MAKKDNKMGNKKTITITIEYFKALKILKPRQVEILEEVAKGHTNREIGNELNLSPSTVKGYRVSICQKLDLEGYRSLYYWSKEYM